MDSFSPYLGFQQLYSQLPQEEKNTRLLNAAKKGNSAIIQILIDSGADVRAKDKNQMTPFLCAVQAGHDQCTFILLQNNPSSFYDIDNNSDNALAIALWYDRKKTFYALLNLPGQYISPEMLSMALFAAAINNHPEEAQILINKGANVNKIHAQDGTTPIMAAVTFESVEMIQLLLSHHADLSLKNNANQNVFDLVKDCMNTMIQNIFSKSIKMPCFMQIPTPKIYPVLPSCPTFVPPCYEPIISEEVNSTEDSLCDDLATLSFFNHNDLKPSAPLLDDLIPIEKGIKRKALCHLNENHHGREIKKAKILCPALLEENIEELRQGIAAISLCDVAPPVVFMMPEKRAPKRPAQNNLIDRDRKCKKAKL